MTTESKIRLNSILGTAFGDIEIDVGDYKVNRDGVDGITDLPVLPVAILQHRKQLASGKNSIENHVRFAVLRGSEISMTEIPLSKLANPNVINEFGNCALFFVDEESRNRFLEYLRTIVGKNFGTLPKKLITSNIGWQDESHFYFGDDDDNFELDCEFPALNTEGILPLWVTAVEPLLQKVTVRIALALSFASVCVKLLGCQTAMLLLHGATGAGKSTLQKIAASVWADPVGGAYIQSAASTDVNLAAMAQFLGGLPLCVDELEARCSRSVQFFMQMAEGLERGTYRKKVKCSSSSCVIFTGEEPLISHRSNPGLANRLLEMEVIGDTLDGVNVCEVLEGCIENRGTAGRKFLSGLLSNATVVADLKSQFALIKQAVYAFCEEKKIMLADKKATMLSLILLGDELAIQHVYNEAVGQEIESLKIENLVSVFCGEEAEPEILAFENFRDYVLSKGVVPCGSFTLVDKVMKSQNEDGYVFVARNFAEAFLNFKGLRTVWTQKGFVCKNTANQGYLFEKMIDGARMKFYKIRILCETSETTNT